MLVLGAFGDPHNVAELNTSTHNAVHWVSNDGLRVAFITEDTSGNANIYRAWRPSLTEEFTSVEVVSELNSADYDGGPFLSTNEREIFFHSDRTGSMGSRDIMTANRNFSGGSFATPTFVTNLNSAFFDGHPALTWDGLNIFFTSWRSGDFAQSDIWMSRRPSLSEPFDDPVQLPGLPDADQDMAPFLNGNALRMYFTHGDGSGEASFDIYYVDRASDAEPFANPTFLATDGVNTSAMEFRYVFSADGCVAFWSSDRLGGAGGYDIWTHTNPDCLSP